jgi:predicted Rossmann fold nucleotide-binding protein DprA/Smf involved in DNA uptake
MKNLKKDLNAVNKGLKALVKKTESLMKAVDEIEKTPATKAVSKPARKAAVKPAKPAKKTVAKKPVKKAEQPTAYDTFLGFLNKNKKGLSIEQIKSKTGFNDKKIANLVYKAKKQGKVKSAGKGVYIKA